MCRVSPCMDVIYSILCILDAQYMSPSLLGDKSVMKVSGLHMCMAEFVLVGSLDSKVTLHLLT